MGAFLDKPKTEKKNEKGGNNAFKYATSSMQGWRVDMEDSHTAKIGLPQLPQWSFFAVFDGHAGSKIAEYSSQHLLDHVLSHKKFQNFINNGEQSEDMPDEDIEEAIREGFLNLDVKMRDLSSTKHDNDRSGSTAVCVFISPKKFYFVNCGDSRGFLCRDSEVHFSTEDHKPGNPLEKERILNAGGSVMIQRVNGSLAVSRALGDYEYKNVESKGPTEQLVSPDPEITVVDRDDNNDQFIILACDGIFDVSTNDELAEYIISRMELHDDLVKVCNSVVDTSLNKGSRDNMTLILIAFPAAPKQSQEAKSREEEMEKKLKAVVHEICSEVKEEPLDIASLMQALAARQDIENLPPGGGVFAKRSLVEAVFKEYVSKTAPEGS